MKFSLESILSNNISCLVFRIFIGILLLFAEWFLFSKLPKCDFIFWPILFILLISFLLIEWVLLLTFLFLSFVFLFLSTCTSKIHFFCKAATQCGCLSVGRRGAIGDPDNTFRTASRLPHSSIYHPSRWAALAFNGVRSGITTELLSFRLMCLQKLFVILLVCVLRNLDWG